MALVLACSNNGLGGVDLFLRNPHGLGGDRRVVAVEQRLLGVVLLHERLERGVLAPGEVPIVRLKVLRPLQLHVREDQPQIRRQRRGCLEPSHREGLAELRLIRVEEDALRPLPVGPRSPVGGVAHQGVANFSEVEPDLVGPAGDNLHVHQRERLLPLRVSKPSYGLVESQGPLRRLAARGPIPAVVGHALARLLGKLHGDLDTAATVHRAVLPVVGPLFLRRRHLDVSVAQGQIVLLCPACLQAVLALELPADLPEAGPGLGADHDPGGLLVQAVAAARLRAGTIGASPAIARDLRGLRCPPLSGAHGVLIVVLERQVLVDLDLALVTIE
mmetsp:Transcript_86980/g.231149  ORF Transcript_86980/g.231149 Transcript_86980/m.231149 type:complete len:331 (+) Transcript_86980:860-1852(+)